MKEIKIGSQLLSLPEGHHLDEVYSQNPQYQSTPWAVLASYLSDSPEEEMILFDLGANIGDSIAHFRVHSNSEVIGIEASKKFFGIALENIRHFPGEIRLLNKLVVTRKNDTHHFVEGSQTGHLSKKNEEGVFYAGDKITPQELLDLTSKKIILKCDLDGFDTELLHGFYKSIIGPNPQSIPLIFFEGPTEKEMYNFQWISTIFLIFKFLRKEYSIILFSNRGDIVLQKSESLFKIFFCFVRLSIGHRRHKAFAHYLDVMAVHKSL